MKIKLIVFIFLIGIYSSVGQSFTGAGSQKPSKDMNSYWKTLTEENFSVKYPPNWELNTSGEDGTKFILFSPLISKNEKFRANINLIIQNLKGLTVDSSSSPINLEEYARRSLIEIKNENIKNGCEVVSSDLVIVDGVSHQKVIYTSVNNGKKLKHEQYYWVKNNNAYVLTLTSLGYKFVDYQSTGEKIFDSFRIR